jgi:hypothetical protein
MPLSRETCPAATEPAPVYDFAERLGNCFPILQRRGRATRHIRGRRVYSRRLA